jgi:hypothetical protein
MRCFYYALKGGGENLISTLILLYALDTGQIPQGCYIATWTISIIEFIAKTVIAVEDMRKIK